MFLLSICSHAPQHPPAPNAAVVINAPPSATPSTSPSASPTASALPPSVLIRVPYTSQAPHADWSTHEDYCEAAALLMYSAYLSRDQREVIPPNEADSRMTRLVQFERTTYRTNHPDLTLDQMGYVAHSMFGMTPHVMPASLDAIKHQLAAGRPVIVPVMTHGAPGGQKLAPFYGYMNVYHVLLIKGYDSRNLYTNDAGFMQGENYAYTWPWLAAAIDSQSAKMHQGRVMLVFG